MDLIYMNSSKEDVGVLKDYKFDLAFGSDENDFECTVNINNHVCEAGYYLYIEGTEYGGIIDSIRVDTDAQEIKYLGRTWHGMLESKVIQPDSGQDYLVVDGEANTVIDLLISRMGLSALFKASTDDSGVNVSNYQMNRYVGAYEGIRKMLKASGGKLNISFKSGFVELSAKPLIDYSKDEQFDTDQIDFDIQKNYKPINHAICLGRGELKDRRVIHVFADELGNISGTQTCTGLEEVTAIYDNANTESDDELKQGGIELIQKSWASMSVNFSFNTDNESIDIGDIIGAKERITGLVVAAMISKKIVTISNNATSISYSCEGYTGTVSSGDYPSSGGGGSMITIDSELSTESENPVQNKVITAAINITNNNLSATTSTAKTANTNASKALTEIPKYKIQTLKAIRAGANYIRIKSTNNTLPYTNPFGILVLSYEGIGFVSFVQVKVKQTPSSYNNVFGSGVVNSGIYALDTNRQFAILAPQGIEFEFY